MTQQGMANADECGPILLVRVPPRHTAAELSATGRFFAQPMVSKKRF
jgi:hypothetical protein